MITATPDEICTSSRSFAIVALNHFLAFFLGLLLFLLALALLP